MAGDKIACPTGEPFQQTSGPERSQAFATVAGATVCAATQGAGGCTATFHAPNVNRIANT
jgi:hypothetical protein